MVVVYNSVENTALLSYNPYGGALPGVLPIPAPQGQVSSSLGSTAKTLQPWAIFLISFGTVVLVTAFVGIIIFAVVKRMPKPEADIETSSSPVGNVAPVSVEDVKISPETWTERPLATVSLAEEEEEEGSIDSSSGTDTDDMEDVQLDEDEVHTTPSSSDSSDEEHL